MNWYASPEVRFLVPDHTTTERPKLQQLWVKNKVNGWGYVDGQESEWRDVPIVVGKSLVSGGDQS